MEKILVSACMIGQKVRYDASEVEPGDGLLERNGVRVFSERNTAEAETYLRRLEGEA